MTRAASGALRARPSMRRLLTEIRGCRACEPELPLGANPVLRAHPEARILIAGQAPGTRVHATGIPWNDPSGERLREWTHIPRDVFYDERQIAVIPMGFCYPGRGRAGDNPPRPECAALWMDRLMAALPAIRLVLPIGAYAHAYHLGAARRRTLTETVRSFRDYGPGVLPLPHPSPRNNLWLARNAWFERDVIPVLRDRCRRILGLRAPRSRRTASRSARTTPPAR